MPKQTPKKMTMAQAFDEWMRKSKEEPKAFLDTMQAMAAHEKPSEQDGVSEYGRDCARLLESLMAIGAKTWEREPLPETTSP